MTKGDDDILEASGSQKRREVHLRSPWTVEDDTHPPAAGRKGLIIKEFSKNVLAVDNGSVDKSCLE